MEKKGPEYEKVRCGLAAVQAGHREETLRKSKARWDNNRKKIIRLHDQQVRFGAAARRIEELRTQSFSLHGQQQQVYLVTNLEEVRENIRRITLMLPNEHTYYFLDDCVVWKEECCFHYRRAPN
jgi:hypothetical protein